MKCERCQRKLTLDHYVATTRPDRKGECLRLVFRCACGIYVVPLDLVEITGSRALVSSSIVTYGRVIEDGESSGKKLSREGLKIYREQGEEAYEKWKEEVYFPLMVSKMKKMKANFFGKRT